MLITLCIKNFVIVEQLELDFDSGMTVFTGETGAGKSIIIDALGLVLGGRTDSSVVRPGQEKCDITACFQIEEDLEPSQWLLNHSLDAEDGVIILRRTVYSNGRSKSYINGQPFPLQKVRELGELLVHIHSQHQHQTLMNPTTHRMLLDRYSKHVDLLNEVKVTYERCQEIVKSIELLSAQEIHHDKVDLLQYQIDELSSLNVQANEMRTLHEEHQLLHHAHDYLSHADQITELLNGDERNTICQGLRQILHSLQILPQEQKTIQSSNELISNALIYCEEAIEEIKQFSETVQLNPERLQEVESRMSILHQIARKYHVDSNELADHREKLKTELDQLKNIESQIAFLQKRYLEETKNFDLAAEKLRSSRQHHAKKIAYEISEIIKQIGMPKGHIDFTLSPLESMQIHGADKVECKVCTNPGMAPDGLNKIASGGELSRISLAIQMITAQRGSTPTLLFDEVDVGIGGATAALVGQLLRKLAERLQVFCVTHQPQVASCAHNHFVVEKYSDDEQTYSRVFSLDRNEKVDEIARMLGGLSITEQTRSNAKELLAQNDMVT